MPALAPKQTKMLVIKNYSKIHLISNVYVILSKINILKLILKY